MPPHRSGAGRKDMGLGKLDSLVTLRTDTEGNWDVCNRC